MQRHQAEKRTANGGMKNEEVTTRIIFNDNMTKKE